MSSGATHAGVSLFIGTASITTGFLTQNPDFFAVGAGALSGVLLTPDLDVDNGNISYWFVGKFLGRPGRFIWTLWWSAYARAIKHRSGLSHFPVLGTVLRLIYIFVPLVTIFIRDQEASFLWNLAYALVAQLISIPLWIGMILMYLYAPEFLTAYASWYVLGLVVSDTAHFIFDQF